MHISSKTTPIAGILLASFAAGQTAREPFRVQAATAPSAYFEINSIRDDASGSNQSYCGFTTQAGDSLFEFGWFYRLAGESANSAFNDALSSPQLLTTPATYSIGPPEVGLNVGSMSVAWSNVDGKNFDASWDVAVTDLGADRATAAHTMTITNPGAAPLALELVLYLDCDVGTFFDQDLRATPAGRFVVIDATTAAYVHVSPQPAPSRWEVASFASDLDGRIIGGAYDLADTGLPFGPDDWTGAFQWSLTVPASSSGAVAVTLGRNVCPNSSGTPATVSHYGSAVGGAMGPLRINSNLPLLGALYEIYVGNGQAGGSISLLVGGQPLAAPYCGIELLVDPWATAPIALDPVGSGSLELPIYCDPGMEGVAIYSQAFAIDLTSPSPCFPLVHSDALHAVIGG